MVIPTGIRAKSGNTDRTDIPISCSLTFLSTSQHMKCSYTEITADSCNTNQTEVSVNRDDRPQAAAIPTELWVSHKLFSLLNLTCNCFHDKQYER
jgi:hypothetical protein